MGGCRERANGCLEFSPEVGGDRRLADRMCLRVEIHMDDRARTGCHGRALLITEGKDGKRVAQAAGADFLNPEAYFERLLESGRLEIFAAHLEAGPALVARPIRRVHPVSE